MFIRRDGSVQGPLWPRAIKDIVIEKFTKVSYTVRLLYMSLLNCAAPGCIHIILVLPVSNIIFSIIQLNAFNEEL